MRKKLALLLAVVMLTGLLAAGVTSLKVSYAKEAQLYMEIPDSIKKGNEFKIRVVLDSDVPLYSIDAYLSYDAQKLEFVPDSDVVVGTEGVLELKDTYGEETKNTSYEITFVALDTGTAEVALTEIYLIDYADMDYVEVVPSVNRFEIGVNEALESDAELAELLVAPGVLTEEFRPEQTEYEMHVGLDVEMIGVTAVPMQEESVVGLDMPEKLSVGENVVTITVTALSGNVKVYTIKVFCEETTEEAAESLSEEDTTEEVQPDVETDEINETETDEQEDSPTEEMVSEETVQTSETDGVDVYMENTEQETEISSDAE